MKKKKEKPPAITATYTFQVSEDGKVKASIQGNLTVKDNAKNLMLISQAIVASFAPAPNKKPSKLKIRK